MHIKKFFAGTLVVIAMTIALPASAQSVADLQAQINALLAQIAVLQGQMASTPSSCFAFTRNLTIGATGEDVRQLQIFLNGKGSVVASTGAGSRGNETTYFGAATSAALARYQAANAISPAAGYFGPVTRAQVHATCSPIPVPTPTPTPNPTPTPGPLQGGAGSIDDARFVSSLNNEEVGEGAQNVDVMGLEIEADRGSDIEITAITLDFSPLTADRDFDRYADEVSVWLDGKRLARVDADMFEDDNNFNRTISLSSSGIIKAGKTGELVIAVSGLKNLDSADLGETWSVAINSIRFRDAQGASISDTSTGDIGNARTFSFETFATARGVELKIQRTNDSPKAGIVNVDSRSDTDNVELLKFTIEAKGSDVVIDELPITLTATGAYLNEIAHAVTLRIGSDRFNESITTSAASSTITFDRLDLEIDEGDKVTVIVLADINKLSGNFTAGDSLIAELTATNRDAIEAEDESGEDLAAGDMRGTALGEQMAFYDSGISVSLISASQSLLGSDGPGNDIGSFVLKFRVEALDDTVYIAATAAATTTANITASTDTEGNLYVVEGAGVATTDGLSNVLNFTKSRGASLSSSGDNIRLDDGESTEISLFVTRLNDSSDDAGFYRMFLGAIAWSTADDTSYNLYTFDLDDFKTDVLYLN
ncbi:peptidoglycan-binding protein [Candidatus Parcubacteria bacterium]|nr:MAG: peptidoglycan-binding protein [Candidatus Parcubacteria bacterium]